MENLSRQDVKVLVCYFIGFSLFILFLPTHCIVKTISTLTCNSFPYNPQFPDLSCGSGIFQYLAIIHCMFVLQYIVITFTPAFPILLSFAHTPWHPSQEIGCSPPCLPCMK